MINIDPDMIKYLECLVKTNGCCFDAIQLFGKHFMCRDCIIKYVGNCIQYGTTAKIAKDLLDNPEKINEIIFDNNL